ncbi:MULTISPECIES: hypothetical protein [unclassified Chamaesiphon]|uniref:hypothetical protein n=1 Tax=unclassified Chamaesiphon TaxID=2620921 RepID=UPI00286BB4EC|nr:MULTISPECIES: hypothetical protein [unclassified Chamaesiphon]
MSNAIQSTQATVGGAAPAENLVRVASLEENRSYDLILIGSGMGALTIASLMTQLRGK